MFVSRACALFVRNRQQSIVRSCLACDTLQTTAVTVGLTEGTTRDQSYPPVLGTWRGFSLQHTPLSEQKDTSGTPPPPQGLLHKLCPPTLLPYAQLIRLDKPIGTWLLAWPCFWSIALAAPAGSLPDPYLLGLFGTGAVLLRGAGCTVNDLWDRDLDRKVARTASRPLAAGTLTPRQALAFLGLQLGAGLGILVQLNEYSIVLGAASLGLVFTYPLMKRITFWPQAYLGLTFNWGALLGWAAVHGSCEWATVLPLYAAGVCWTLVYDTIYAHQDQDDDLAAGIKSTALRFGAESKYWLTGFAAAELALLGFVGLEQAMPMFYYGGLLAAAGHLGWQIATVDLSSRADCSAKFGSNRDFGAIIMTAIAGGKLFALT